MKKKVYYIVFAVILLMFGMGSTAKAETLTQNITIDKDKFKDDSGVYDYWSSSIGKTSYFGQFMSPYGYCQAVIGVAVPALPDLDTVTSIQLYYNVQNASNSPQLNLYGSYEDGWTETDAAIPSSDVEIVTGQSVGTGWQAVDVTDFVKEQYTNDGYATFVMKPTSTAGINTVCFYSNEAGSSAPFLKVSYTNPSAEITASESIKESNIDGMEINVTILDDSFLTASLSSDMFSLDAESTANGITVAGVTYVDATHATLILAQDGRDIDVDFYISVTVRETALAVGKELTSNGIYV